MRYFRSTLLNKLAFISLVVFFFSCGKGDVEMDSSFTNNRPQTSEPAANTSFNLTINSSLGGSTNTNGGEYEQGQQVSVLATAINGFLFHSWQGLNVLSTDNPITITINSNVTLTPRFIDVSTFEDLISSPPNECFEYSLNDVPLYSSSGQVTIEGDYWYDNYESRFGTRPGNIFFHRMSHTPKEFSYVAQNIFGDSFNVSDFHLDLIYNGDNNRLFHMYLSRGSQGTHIRVENDFSESLFELFNLLDSSFNDRYRNNEITNDIEDGLYKSTRYLKLWQEPDQNECDQDFYDYDTSNSAEENSYKFYYIENNIPTHFNDYTVYSSTFNECLLPYGEIPGSTSTYDFVQISKIFGKVIFTETREGSNYFEKLILEKVDESELDFNYYRNCEESEFFNDPVYSTIIPNDLDSYLDAFILDANRYGLSITKGDFSTIEFNLPTQAPSSIPEARGWASGWCDDDRVEIGLLRSFFEDEADNYYSKELPDIVKVMWHEFGHDILNLDHLCLGGHIMSGRHYNPQIYYDSNDCNSEYINVNLLEYNSREDFSDWERAVSDMFNSVEQVNYNCSSNKSSKIYIE